MTSQVSGTTRSSFQRPEACVVDRSGNLYVVDTGNQRVLFFPKGSNQASRVYGQDFFNTSGSGCASNLLNDPAGVALDSKDNLFVADARNNRVLVYANGSRTPFNVLGQADFSSCFPNRNGSVSALTLSLTIDVAVDANDGVYIVDNENVRVVLYPLGASTPLGGTVGATLAYGQPSLASALKGTSDRLIGDPSGLALDSTLGVLYIAQGNSNRITTFRLGDTVNQIQVFGQASFNTSQRGTSATAFWFPIGLALNPSGQLFVADTFNNRVLLFGNDLLSGSSTGGTYKSSIIPAGSVFTVFNGTLTINGDLYVLGMLVLESPAVVVIAGTLNVSGSLVITPSAFIDARTLCLGSTSAFGVNLRASEEVKSFSTMVLKYNSSSGSFATATAIGWQDDCIVVSVVPRFSSRNLTIVVSFINSCGLCKKSIVGNVVGIIFVVVVIGIAILIFVFKRRKSVSQISTFSELSPILSTDE
jgi:sugar lactone lactonase YvrE